MKKVLGILLVTGLAVGVAIAAFTVPTADQIKAAAKDPTQLNALIQGASAEQAAQVMIAVIQEIEKSDLPMDEKQAKVALLVDEMNGEMGDMAPAVMGIVATSVNPELLPAVGAVSAPVAPLSLPIGQPLAPPVQSQQQGETEGQPPVGVRYPGE
jgi:hypothetical protein